MTSSAPPGLARLNDAAAPSAARLLFEVCGSTAWSAAMAAGRPYPRVGDLLAASDAAMAALTAGDLGEAMAAHPPIGRPEPGDAASAREQSGVGDTERAELLRLNLAYQQAHGHVFLICATGRTGAQMLAALKERIGNDPGTEREIVRTELAAINRIRLTRLAGTRAGTAASTDAHETNAAAGAHAATRPDTATAIHAGVTAGATAGATTRARAGADAALHRREDLA